jgi:hypothetical protein
VANRSGTDKHFGAMLRDLAYGVDCSGGAKGYFDHPKSTIGQSIGQRQRIACVF